MEDPLQERVVGPPGQLAVDLEDAQRRPGVHRRVDVAEGPFVGGQLAVGVHVPLARQQHQLLLGRGRIQPRQRQAVERKVPGRIPGILPGVRHRDHVGVVEVEPVGVAAAPAAGGGRRLTWIAFQPLRHVEVVILPAPQQAGQRLPLHAPRLGVGGGARQPGVELVGLRRPIPQHALGQGAGEAPRSALPRRHRSFPRRSGALPRRPRSLPRRLARQAQANARRPARGHFQAVVHRRLGAPPRRAHRPGVAVHQVLVETVLEGGARPGSVPGGLPGRGAEETPEVALVIAEQQRGRRPRRSRLGVEPEDAQLRVLGADRSRGRRQRRPRLARAPPRPGVAEPELRQQVERRRLGAAVVDGDPEEDVLRRRLGVLDEDVEVAVVVEDAGVEQLELRVQLAAAAVLLDQPGVGKLRLRVLVEHPEVGGGRRRVEEVVLLLQVLAVVALRAGEAEGALLEDRVAAVPQRQPQAEALLVVAQAGQAVLAPAVGAAAGVVVRKIVPRGAAGAVILAHGPPLPLGEVGAPAPPGSLAAVGRRQPPALGIGAVALHGATSQNTLIASRAVVRVSISSR